jgi:hypothetical protein
VSGDYRDEPLDPDDLRIDVFTNTAGCAVRITHLPTGIVETADGGPGERIATRRRAMDALAARLEMETLMPDQPHFGPSAPLPPGHPEALPGARSVLIPEGDLCDRLEAWLATQGYAMAGPVPLRTELPTYLLHPVPTPPQVHGDWAPPTEPPVTAREPLLRAARLPYPPETAEWGPGWQQVIDEYAVVHAYQPNGMGAAVDWWNERADWLAKGEQLQDP